MIDAKKSLAIELLIEGSLTKEEIAKKCGRSRQWVYQHVIHNDECKAEMDRQLQVIKSEAEKKFSSKLPQALDKLWEIIESNADVRTRAQAVEYWIDKVMGKNTAKLEIEDTTDKDKDNVDDIINDYNKFIALKEAK